MADVYTVYPIAKKLIPSGSIDLVNDTIKVALPAEQRRSLK